jgi:TPR repeat protein
VTLDYAQFLTWYRKSAAQGFAPAQNQLATIYENSIGVPRDYKRAATYYRLAANQGYALAQYNLAAMFEAGRGFVTTSKPSLGTAKRPTRISPPPSRKSATSTSADLGSSLTTLRLWPGIAAPPTTATPTPKTS